MQRLRNPGEPPARLDQLDALRGLAAVSVALGHWVMLWTPQSVPGRQTLIFRAALAAHDPRVLAQLGGYVLLMLSPFRIFFAGSESVVLFFALSGFVLSLSFRDGRSPDFKPYLIKRIFRIYVPYLGALALAVVGDAIFSRGGIPQLNQWFNATWHSPPDVKTLLNSVLLIGSYDDSAFNTAFWSLIHEMRISLIFPFLMIVMNAAGAKARLIPVPLIIIGAWLAERMPGGRLFESLQVMGIFLGGACLARSRGQVVARYRQWKSGARFCWIAASLGLYTYGWAWIFPAHAEGWSLRYKDVFVCLGALGLIVTALASRPVTSFLESTVPQALGKVSYSLYLVHATLLWGVVYALYPKYGAGIIFVVWMFLLIPTTFLFWKLIEDPANQRGRRLASTITGPDITSREANAAGKLN